MGNLRAEDKKILTLFVVGVRLSCVREMGLEPTLPKEQEPKSCAATNYATRAMFAVHTRRLRQGIHSVPIVLGVLV